MKKRSTALLLALIMVVGITVGGTLAWLLDQTAPIKNTFTVGNVTIELTEDAGKDENYQFQMIPGSPITKDPKITVGPTSEDCYVFVEITESANLDTYIEYALADGWTLVTGETNVWWKAAAANAELQILKDNTVTVKNSVDEDDMTAAETNQPSLTFMAYAIQSANMTDANFAWTKLEEALAAS